MFLLLSIGKLDGWEFLSFSSLLFANVAGSTFVSYLVVSDCGNCMFCCIVEFVAVVCMVVLHWVVFFNA